MSSSNENNKSNHCTYVNPSISSLISGIYGSLQEPLHPTTRTTKRQLMENTISDLLDKLDYTGYMYSESKKKCKSLKNLVESKNKEIQFLTGEVAILLGEVAMLKKQKQDMLDDYQDLFKRYRLKKDN